MDFWPSFIAAPNGISGGLDDPYIEAQSETGDDASRPRFSAPRLTPFKLSWQNMRLAECRYLLDQFYPAHRAITFLWRHPSQGLTYEVRFVSSPITFGEEGTAPFVAKVEVQLQPERLAPTEQAQPSIDDLMQTINAGADKAVDAALEAAASRDNAAASASTASTKASAATASATAAKASETAAAGSASTASTKASAAYTSAQAAAASAERAEQAAGSVEKTPIATSTIAGKVKPSTGLIVAADGTLTVDFASINTALTALTSRVASVEEQLAALQAQNIVVK
jgi:hypothetical protein